MPWSPSQHRLFEAAAHNPAVAKKTGIPQAQAAQMAGEGVKRVTEVVAQRKLTNRRY